MELLLILSAMLSAVTGAFSSTRGPEPRAPLAEAAVGAQVAAAVAERQAPQPAASRPADDPPSREVPALPSFAIADPVPVQTDRLIE